MGTSLSQVLARQHAGVVLLLLLVASGECAGEKESVSRSPSSMLHSLYGAMGGLMRSGASDTACLHAARITSCIAAQLGTLWSVVVVHITLMGLQAVAFTIFTGIHQIESSKLNVVCAYHVLLSLMVPLAATAAAAAAIAAVVAASAQHCQC